MHSDMLTCDVEPETYAPYAEPLVVNCKYLCLRDVERYT